MGYEVEALCDARYLPPRTQHLIPPTLFCSQLTNFSRSRCQLSAQRPNNLHETPVIPEQLPDDDAPQPALAHIVDLGAYGLRIIVCDPRSTARIIEPRHARRGFPVALVTVIANACAGDLPPISILPLPILWRAA